MPREITYSCNDCNKKCQLTISNYNPDYNPLQLESCVFSPEIDVIWNEINKQTSTKCQKKK